MLKTANLCGNLNKIPNQLCIYRCAFYSSEHRRSIGKTKGFMKCPNETEIDGDYIGPPDPKSNLRPVVRHISKHETELEKRLRLKRIAVEEWNQNIWAKHNDEFYKQKLDFMKEHKASEDDTLSADKMSEFYKTFLDKNWKFHLSYNWEWYRKNFELLLLSLQLTLTGKKKNFK